MPRAGRRSLAITASVALLAGALPTAAFAQLPSTDDPRVGLGGGAFDAETATLGMEQTGFFDKRESPFFDPATSLSPNVAAAIGTANSDMAFTGDHVIHGNWRGFQIYDISDPSNPTLRTEVLCPGGQGDVNVHGNLLFHSVEQATARVDCGAQGTLPGDQPDPERFRGVRIWDISDLDNPFQVAAVQTCRGSHTNRLVEDPNDPTRVYIYNNGTSTFRHPDEEPGCTDHPLTTDPVTDENVDRWQIEVIEVPLANPAAARIVNEARLFADEETGALNGLNNTQSGALHPCATAAEGSCAPAGAAYSPLPNTNTCHDITAYPEIGLAAGACQGNGILIDISDPADPVRIDAVADPNFSYWHSANFSNDGTKVLFTDEWGGGTGPRCAANHQLSWGANALFEIVDGKLEFASYYKLPAPQTNTENCVAHQANIVPVPGRDVIVQAWYQGGISMFDWTDPKNPFEIGYFDRGPIDEEVMILGGHWSGYWYNGNVFGAEIARGLDVLDLTPTDDLTANEIEAAKTVQLDEHNAMSMRMITWEPSFPLIRATIDQLARDGSLAANKAKQVYGFVERAERFADGPQRNAAKPQLQNALKQLNSADHQRLIDAINDVMATL
ncbi:LVIVD repeat-containing protein [Egicoccus sp. AB-alg2]|uniref:LVIVD repeat-containing protein n=1 Tax=Egicoccus sp. AB-alg2 TaxID=3242693 RepID=UPI00359CBFB9